MAHNDFTFSDKALYQAGLLVAARLLGFQVLGASKKTIYTFCDRPGRELALSDCGGQAALNLFKRPPRWPFKGKNDRARAVAIVGESTIPTLIARAERLLAPHKDDLARFAYRLDTEPFLPEYIDPKGLLQSCVQMTPEWIRAHQASQGTVIGPQPAVLPPDWQR